MGNVTNSQAFSVVDQPRKSILTKRCNTRFEGFVLLEGDRFQTLTVTLVRDAMTLFPFWCHG